MNLIQVDPLAGIISLIAVFISIYSFFSLQKLTLRIKESEEKFNNSYFYFDRNTHFEGFLKDCPECFKMYQVNLKEAEEAGISHREIVYLLEGVSLITTICSQEKRDLMMYIQENEYWSSFLKNEHTKIVWKYTRQMVSNPIKENIDRFVNTTNSS